jgi:hypothetical protein
VESRAGRQPRRPIHYDDVQVDVDRAVVAGSAADAVVASSPQMALAGATRELLHGRCHGGYHDQHGTLKRCTCDCHPANLTLDPSDTRFPVMTEPTADGTDADRSDRKKPQKRPPAVRNTGARCHCGCGAAVRGFFLPGHDAKLKSALTRAARGGDVTAWAELVLRGWDRQVALGTVPTRVADSGGVHALQIQRQGAKAVGEWLALRAAAR